MRTSKLAKNIRNLFIALAISPAVFVLVLELTLHGLFFLNIFPDFPALLTRLEKIDYRPKSQIIYKDNIPHRSEGIGIYAQRGIPRQFIRFGRDGNREDAYDGPAKCLIGVFGDSYTAALQVGQSEDYSSLTETALRSAGYDVNFRNFGLSGTGTTVEYLRYLQLRDEDHHFDHVILQFFPGNDIEENHIALHRFNDKGNGNPYLRIKDGTLIREDYASSIDSHSSKARMRNFLAQYSHLANLAHMLRFNFSVYMARENRFDVFKPPPNSDWKEAWEVTEMVLRKWIEEVHSTESNFTVLMLTSMAQLSEDMNTDPAAMPDYPNRRIRLVAKNNQANYLDILPKALEYIQLNNLKHPYFSWTHDGHYSQLGHSLVSNSLVPFMQDKLSHCKFDVSAAAS